MIRAAGQLGWLDEERAMMEALTGHPPRRRRHRHHLLRQGRRPRCSSSGRSELSRVRISAKGEYAIKAMLDLAAPPRARPHRPSRTIAARQAHPAALPRAGPAPLKRAGLLTSKRGSAGGYQLTRPPEDITVGDVLRAVEGAGAPVRRAAGRPRRRRRRDLGELWDEIAEAVRPWSTAHARRSGGARSIARRPRPMYRVLARAEERRDRRARCTTA